MTHVDRDGQILDIQNATHELSCSESHRRRRSIDRIELRDVGTAYSEFTFRLVSGSGSLGPGAGERPLGSTGPKDVASGVSIGAVLVTARSTSKLRLADAVRGVAMSAFGTALTRVAAIDEHDLSTGALCLIVLDSFI
jgi:hypothetical protein